MFDDLKPILILLLRFLATYLGLILLYQFYLNLYSDAAADPLTKIIAEQSTFCMNKMGYNTQLIESTEKSGLYFYINNIWATTMIEGCNAVSIMILYLAFIFTFYKGLQTFWFAALGLVFLYVVNVTRIALINMSIWNFHRSILRLLMIMPFLPLSMEAWFFFGLSGLNSLF